MQEIQFIVPAALHDEMLRLRNEKQMEYYQKHNSLDIITTFAEHTRIDKILKVSFAAFRVITLLFLKKGEKQQEKRRVKE